MLGELNELEIERLLEQQRIGRIGCHADGLTYIVPINYVYQDGCIYAHSGPGKKIEMLDKNPQVCFQVDDIQDLLNWKSVITWVVMRKLPAARRCRKRCKKSSNISCQPWLVAMEVHLTDLHQMKAI